MPKRRPDPNFHKQLKPFKIEAAEDGWIKIICGHCSGVAYVKRGLWLHSKSNAHLIGRSCTYCFKAGRIIT